MGRGVDFLTGGPANPVSVIYPLGAPIKVGESRESRIRKRGSPYFHVSLGVLAAEKTRYYDLEETPELRGTQEYLPLDFIRLVNSDDVDLLLRLGEDNKIFCPAGTIQVSDDKSFNNFAVQNLDALTDTTDGKVRLELRRLPMDQDRLLRERL